MIIGRGAASFSSFRFPPRRGEGAKTQVIEGRGQQNFVIEAVVEYIQMNPVRRRLVKRAGDWKWP
jgi:hypothetical protein